MLVRFSAAVASSIHSSSISKSGCVSSEPCSLGHQLRF